MLLALSSARPNESRCGGGVASLASVGINETGGGLLDLPKRTGGKIA